MTPHFDTVAIVGVGLLGGSLGLALKARGLAGTVRGVGRRQSSLDTAKQAGAIDETFLDATEAVRGAGLIVICTPAALTPRVLDDIRPICAPDAIVTDVTSTKAEICRHACATWPSPRRFVGSHPMAGSEKHGPEHAYESLYEGCITIIEKGARIDAEAAQAVRALWEAVGARVVEMDPADHDAVVARTSHIPHVVAAGLAILASRMGPVQALVGPGFRDATRIAGSRPEVWRDICLTNAAAIAEGLGALTAELQEIQAAIEAGDAARIEAFFEAGRAARREVVGQ